MVKKKRKARRALELFSVNSPFKPKVVENKKKYKRKVRTKKTIV